MVEVWQGTLSMDGRGWGPAPNNVDRGSQLDEEDEEDEEEENEEEKEDEERKAANIKSNNPHLAGGEKHHLLYQNLPHPTAFGGKCRTILVFELVQFHELFSKTDRISPVFWELSQWWFE